MRDLPWGPVLLGCTASTVTMASFINFAPLLPLVREELLLTNTWAGMLVSATMLAHMLFQIPGGQVAASIGAKRTVTLGMTVIGASLMATGFAPSFPLLLLFRFTLGVGTGLAFISGLALVASMVPLKWRVQVQGLYGAAGNAGVLMALLFSERMASLTGWRGSFVLEGIVVLLVATMATVWLPAASPTSRLAAAPWAELFRQPVLYLLGLGHILTYGVFIALSTWGATFLWETHGVGLEWAGPLAAMLAASAVVGRLVGGVIARGRERRVILVGVMGTAVMTGLLPLAPSAPAAILVLLVLGWFASMPFGALFFYGSLVSERLASPRALGLINFVANIGAFAFPPAVGYALDLTGAFSPGFGLLAAVGLMGLAALVVWLPRVGGAR
jgi:nitrate/nitrite transporter NarK